MLGCHLAVGHAAHLWVLLGGRQGGPRFGVLRILRIAVIFAGFWLLSNAWHLLCHAQRRPPAPFNPRRVLMSSRSRALIVATLLGAAGLAIAQPAPAPAASGAGMDCSKKAVARHDHGAEKGMPSKPRGMPCDPAPAATASAAQAAAAASQAALRHDHAKVHKNQ